MRDEVLADLVDAMLIISRKVHASPSTDEEFVSLTQLEGLTMQHIDRHPGVRASQLAGELGLRSSNASAALRDLERKGMILRAADPDDRRVVTIWPTERAHDNLTRMRAHWAGLLRGVIATDDQLDTARGVVRAIESALSDAPRRAGH